MWSKWSNTSIRQGRTTKGTKKRLELRKSIPGASGGEKGRGPSRASPGRHTIDPLRKGSMQVLGEANNWEREARTGCYDTQTQNQAIRLLQNRVVLSSGCWAGIIIFTVLIDGGVAVGLCAIVVLLGPMGWQSTYPILRIGVQLSGAGSLITVYIALLQQG